jgi:hypothetical protein
MVLGCFKYVLMFSIYTQNVVRAVLYSHVQASFKLYLQRFRYILKEKNAQTQPIGVHQFF